jgi:beta-lactamase class D
MLPAILLLMLAQLWNASFAWEMKLNTTDLDAIFHGYDSAFVLLDGTTNEYFRYHPERCAERLSPCSTFKIFNSLTGLETGVLKDENHLMRWDGKPGLLDAWNKDQTLKTAVRDSVVWYFKRVAQGIGEKRMKEYLHRVQYGNEDISGGLTEFWIGSSLLISADEQVEFVRKLFENRLPYSERTMKIVRDVIRLKETPLSVLSGKTGSDMVNSKKILGWFVGYVVHEGRPYFFATNIRAEDEAWGPKARALTEAILEKMHLL